jgi:hypothetical protein
VAALILRGVVEELYFQVVAVSPLEAMLVVNCTMNCQYLDPLLLFPRAFDSRCTLPMGGAELFALFVLFDCWYSYRVSRNSKRLTRELLELLKHEDQNISLSIRAANAVSVLDSMSQDRR